MSLARGFAHARHYRLPERVRVQDDPTPDRNIFIRSDQYSFIKKGVPALFLSFGYEAGSPEEKTANAWFEGTKKLRPGSIS
jgi:Zn-dependent M28 family amino/carboxypeptidase